MAATNQPRLPRRALLDSILGFGFVSSAVAALYPVTRFLVPPAGGEPSTTSVVAAKAAQVPPNTGLVFPFGSKPAILVRTTEGEFRAFTAVCTHLECTVQYKAETSQIWCACHNGLYDLTGNVVSGPPPRGLESFAVALRGEPGKEDVVVSRS
jgi:Rieske Fe-S protein